LNVPYGHTGHRVCPHIWAPQPPCTVRPALGQVHRVKSPVAQIPCLSPYPDHHALFRSPRSKLRVERFTLNVPNRYIGHRVCPHIWVPQPAGTTQPALGQVRRVKSPSAQIPCLSPYPAHRAPFRSPRSKLRVERFTLNVPDRYIAHRVCPHLWVPGPAWTTQPALGQVRRVKSPVVQIPCLSPYPAHHSPFRSAR